MIPGVTKKSAVIPLDGSSPIAFINVFEDRDVWVKVQGCEACSEENRARCCGNCKVILPDAKCPYNFQKNSNKPLFCVMNPTPDKADPHCSLEYKCVAGSRIGKIRRVKDPGDVFV